MKKIVYVIQRQLTEVSVAQPAGVNNSWTDFMICRKIFQSKEDACVEVLRMAQDCTATYGLCFTDEELSKVTIEKIKEENGTAFVARGTDGDLYVVTIKVIMCHLIEET